MLRKLGFLILICQKRGKWSYRGKKIQLHRERYLLRFGEFTSNEGMLAELKTLGGWGGKIREGICPVNLPEGNESSKT